MADKSTGGGEAKVTLPEGMTQADFEQAFQTFLKQRVQGQARDKANRAAIKQLIANHKAEYDNLVEQNWPK